MPSFAIVASAGASGMTVQSVVDAMGDSLGLVTTILTAIAGQPILMFFMGCSFVGVGIGMWRKLRRAAH